MPSTCTIEDFGWCTRSVSTSAFFVGKNLTWLVVSIPLKNMSLSVGMMIFPTEWKNHPFMFQTTNQITIHRSFRPHTSPLPRSMFTHLIGRYSAFILDPTANLVKSEISPRFVDFTCATGLPQFRTWIQNAIALSNYR